MHRAGLPEFGLRQKYLLLASAIAVFSTVIVSVVYSAWIERLALARAEGKLDVETQLVSSQIKYGVDRLRHDILTISRMPPFEGLARSVLNAGLDRKDRSSTEQWRRRLETIFMSMMEARPEYFQMRYVGLRDDGKELVRVDRVRDGTVEPMPRERLQSKSSQPYFIDSLKLKTGEVYFSDLTLNRDFGRVESDRPTLRAITPVFGPHGKKFGLFVINVNFDSLVRRILQEVSDSSDLYVVTGKGDYIHRNSLGAIAPLVFAGAGKPVPPVLAIQREDIPADGARVASLADRIVAVREIVPDVINGTPIRIILDAPKASFLADVNAVRRDALLLAICLIIAMALIAYVVSRKLMQPMKELSETLHRYDPDWDVDNLPVQRRDEIGEVARALTVVMERRKKAEEARDRMLAHLQPVLDNSVDAMISITAAGEVTHFNKSAERIFGYEAAEVVGKNVKMLMPRKFSDAHDGYLRHHLETGEANIIGTVRELSAMTKSGEVIPVELSVSRIELESGPVFSGVVREISMRKRMEESIRKHAAALERSNNDLEEFAYIASHDLKEPIRGINNHVRFLAEDHGAKLGEDGLKRVERMVELCARADRIVSDLLHFSRLGRAEFEALTIRPEALVEDAKETLADYLAERNAEIRIVSELPPVVGDRSRLGSLVHNLILNGVKYNDRPERVIEIGFSSETAPGNSQSGAYYVRDNGIGISSDMAASVFKIFKRLNNEKAYGPGSGVGLSFARKIVERHGGELWFESEPGAGTTFFFTLAGRGQ